MKRVAMGHAPAEEIPAGAEHATRCRELPETSRDESRPRERRNERMRIPVRSSNPVMNSLTSTVGQNSSGGGAGAGSAYAGYNTYGAGYGAGAQDAQLGQSYGQQQYAQQTSARPITVDDVVTKTGITLAVIVALAVVNFGIAVYVSPGIAAMLSLVGAIGGFVTTLVASFGKKWGSAGLTLTYAVFEGLFVGGFSFLFASTTIGNISAASLIGQAVLGTVGVFAGMLFAYKTGAVRVTPKFTKILVGCIFGVVILSLGNLLLMMFTGLNPLYGGGPIAIIFSLVCIVLAALSFLTDFEQADRLIRAGAPAQTAWGVALGLAVTLVWLYTEILRLLSYFNRN